MGRYVTGFDREAVNEFGRAEWDETVFMRLSDAHPLFNVAGLYYRVPTDQ
jgi:hypothetical protein